MQTVGLKRDQKDQYYTKNKVAKECIEIFDKNIDMNGMIIEPSAGNGAFYDALRPKHKVLAYDIQPAISSILEQDFLKLDLNKCFHVPLHFVGNPPFGRQSSLAKKFIKHICNCDRSESISFILPRSFKKPSLQRTFPLNWHLIHENDIEKNAFLVNDKEHDVPCVFQIWIKKETERKLPKKQVPIGYSFVKDRMKATFALRRVGVYAGKIIDMLQDTVDFEKISEQSHYFITFDFPTTFKWRDIFKEKFYKISFDKNNTVGPRSISKQEFIVHLNNIININ
jgi:hypothetical protein